jgi:hypothetical protein
VATKNNGRRTQQDASPGPSSQAQRPPCQCGCGDFPAGKRSRFLPGHDAKLASAEKKAKADAAPVAPAGVNAGDRRQRPLRRPARQGDTSRAAGSEG